MFASDVMDLSASLLNDSAKSVFTYASQLPYLNSAYDELAQAFETNELPTTNELSAALTITTAMKDIGGSTGPALPTDLVEIQEVFERTAGSNSDFIEMHRCDFLPEIVELTNELTWWAWQNQIIQFLGANTNREVKLEYLGNTFGTITDQTTVIRIINSKNFLAFRNAALCAVYIGENPTRAQELDIDAQKHLDKLIGLNVKGRQVMPVRRRPFMAGYRSISRL